MIKAYGDRALRLRKAGFDCVELKGATNDLLNAYCSRRGN
jgi:2,4-dienoyl-CoA reductase-like NADH-dependent reductase (Old Yellow Enzyme family)